MNTDALIKALRNEGKNYEKDTDSPIGHISELLLQAADVIEEQMKIADELHDAMHHALSCPETNCLDIEGLCDWWELTRN